MRQLPALRVEHRHGHGGRRKTGRYDFQPTFGQFPLNAVTRYTSDATLEMTMKPSITYVHLLAHTPFFTALSADQLRWVIDYPREGIPKPGQSLPRMIRPAHPLRMTGSCATGQWRRHYDGNTYPSGHAAPGKWFNVREA